MSNLPSGFGRAAAEWRQERDAAERSWPMRPTGPIPDNRIKRDPRQMAGSAAGARRPLARRAVRPGLPSRKHRPWVADFAERMQCPPEFVAVPAMVALGAVLGRKLAVRPQRKTDWAEVPNLWGCIVGRPGMLKNPAMAEALKPLHRLEKTAREAHASAQAAHTRELELFKLKSDAARDAARKALRRCPAASLPDDLIEPEPPKARRYVVNDTSYEALGEILADNPHGVLAFRDEFVSLLKGLDGEEHAAARGFFLTAWTGRAATPLTGSIRDGEAATISFL